MLKEKIKNKLKILLKRDPTPNEEENAKKDVNIMQDIQNDEIESIKARLVELEKKVK